MIRKTTMKLDGRFMKQVRGRIAEHQFDIGVLKDSAHKRAIPNSSKNLAGGPARRTGRPTSTQTSEVSEYARKSTRINFYTKPFQNRSNREIVKFANQFLKSLMSKAGLFAERRRVENLLQAIVRNPILRGDYGKNTPATTRKKGFSRRFIDTGQLFRSIIARITRRR